MDHTEHLSCKTVSGPEDKKGVVEAAGGAYLPEMLTIDQNLMTGRTEGDTLSSFVSAAVDMVVESMMAQKQAA